MSEKAEIAMTEDVTDLNQDATYKSLNRKWDFRILPVLFLIFFSSFLDRASIGNASIAGLGKDLSLKGQSYNIALALFFVVYLLVDVPAVWLFKIVGRGRFLSASVVCWGCTTLGIGFVTNEAQLYALRCMLGFFEGGLTPCLFLYLGLFYSRYELQSRIAWFYISAPLSNAVGGLLASGLGQIHVGRYRTWRWIFIVEGAATILLGFFCWFVLPNKPSDAGYLTAEEKVVAEARLAENTNSFGNEAEQREKFNIKKAGRGIFDQNTILIAVASLGIYCNVYAYSLFSPTIIRQFGYSVVDSQLLSAPPYVLAAIWVLVSCYLSDRLRLRGPFMLFGSVLLIIGWTIQLACHGTGVRYFGLFVVAVGAFGSIPPSLTWLINNVQPEISRNTATGLVVAFGNVGGIITTFTYMGSGGPKTGNALQIGMSCLTLVCTGSLMMINSWENKKRARGERDYRLTNGKTPAEQLGSRHPEFRLCL
ncbi:putative transporter [Cyphellophora attinorum]|uniref:Putative transporter n=1 Tax=Cyphellophora attinorum TaxID=1664694 RepID=A0A0N1HH92_9EURO|nr:putative transporter [Phialophora attinorum]KPI45310.1 putative transporter [Phialophora attinorum]